MKRGSVHLLRSGALILLLTLIFAGCSTPSTNGTDAGTPPATPNQNESTSTDDSSTTSQAPETKSFTDTVGVKEIPVNPQRIFSISASTQLLALGVTPVGGLQYEIEQDYYLRGYADQIKIAGDYPPNMEAILELQPDLIIASSFVSEDIVAQLEQIAPTVLYPWEANLYDQLRYISDIIDKQEEAERWIAAHDAKASQRKEEISKLVEPGATVAAIEIIKQSFQVAGNRNMGYVLHDLLGLKRLPFVQEAIDKNEGYLVYTDGQSLEMLPELTADYLIVKVNDTQPGSTDFFEEMQQSSLWKTLPAVQKNQVFVVPHDQWWSYTLFSTDALLDKAVALFQIAK
ncbi:hypothetical protein PA598K_02149 [Paenibacillus sp. 598K]|uniref:ABC transporter substrate-binding protein n=1 Tax=Paenibacillus sp. 598K TaxID=1117987 RepID=UPI000FF9AB24|nr:ABC transporter substrate-binding protein [Paenibacillus sp. 598K]GBF73827.1 hypothetical protein PA598K_02149 [Paenibacillus sp. 598K]